MVSANGAQDPGELPKGSAMLSGSPGSLSSSRAKAVMDSARISL